MRLQSPNKSKLVFYVIFLMGDIKCAIKKAKRRHKGGRLATELRHNHLDSNRDWLRSNDLLFTFMSV